MCKLWPMDSIDVWKFLLVLSGSLGLALSFTHRTGGGLAHRNFLTGGKLNGKQVLLVYVVTFVLVAGYFYVINP